MSAQTRKDPKNLTYAHSHLVSFHICFVVLDILEKIEMHIMNNLEITFCN